MKIEEIIADAIFNSECDLLDCEDVWTQNAKSAIEALEQAGYVIVNTKNIEKRVLIEGKNTEEDMLRRGHGWSLAYKEAFIAMIQQAKEDMSNEK